ncbi:ATPase associated with various cellular activities AAA_3 [Thiorhodococcus drewsii AZ1]|uniref:ATPase associated with various cellular activities AAA_3 n=1 Tax=Thiorhodococcus drewsii AZ1 TaxID=765913 RepID=G2E691_9GAMM|nr:AAA family ATPase [Thiorhodococcus drewsii]EGV28439.1 ATPase associated with various cellular activities AAA_3 [Thiorhodococcus drewsii AZ1]
MSLTQRHPRPRANLTESILDSARAVILGKDRELRLALACLLARGHLLIEDLPGVGKTTLAHLLARLLGLDYSRIQFTSDLLPADVIGVSVYDRASEGFRFHPGPIFSQLVLADEINRATPKAQSALLEAMEERQVTVDGETRPLPEPFFVIATQNPLFQVGTFPLPESQLDRFLMRIQLGYPDAEQEKTLLAGEDRRAMVARQAPALDNAQLIALQDAVFQVHAAPPIIDYVHAILQFTRASERFAFGLSPRAGLGMLHAAKAWALMADRDYTIPEDVQAVLPACAVHRLSAGAAGQRVGEEEIATFLLERVPV